MSSRQLPFSGLGRYLSSRHCDATPGLLLGVEADPGDLSCHDRGGSGKTVITTVIVLLLSLQWCCYCCNDCGGAASVTVVMRLT